MPYFAYDTGNTHPITGLIAREWPVAHYSGPSGQNVFPHELYSPEGINVPHLPLATTGQGQQSFAHPYDAAPPVGDWSDVLLRWHTNLIAPHGYIPNINHAAEFHATFSGAIDEADFTLQPILPISPFKARWLRN